MISVLVRLDSFSFKKTLSISGATEASWKITDNIDSGSKFNSLDLDKILQLMCHSNFYKIKRSKKVCYALKI